MDPNPKIDFVYGEYWVGMYINGELVLSDHTLDVGSVLFKLGFCFTRRNVDDEWLEDCGDLPTQLNDIPKKLLGREW